MTDNRSQITPEATPTNRRRFLEDAARTAAGVAAFGLMLGLYARKARSLPIAHLRPPGALDNADFLGACLRCGLCARDCPYDTLHLAKLEDDVATGTPYFVARNVPCEMCEDIPCIKACPSGALDKSLTNIDDARMGTAVLSDRENCLNVLGLRCDVCYRVCPLMGEAITLERSHNQRTGKHAIFVPTLHADKCTGCGKCERACVLEEAAIKVFPTQLAQGAIGEHYRLGWKEKEAHGAPLVPGLTDLPDRLPETTP
jgi:ferredoxin-type protein NapG